MKRLTKYFWPRWRTAFQTDNRNLSQHCSVCCSVSSTVLQMLQLSNCFSSSGKHTRAEEWVLTSFTWRVNSKRACCLSGRPDGWLLGWLSGRLSAHICLSLTPTYSVFLTYTASHMICFCGGMTPLKNVWEIHSHLIMLRLQCWKHWTGTYVFLPELTAKEVNGLIPRYFKRKKPT